MRGSVRYKCGDGPRSLLPFFLTFRCLATPFYQCPAKYCGNVRPLNLCRSYSPRTRPCYTPFSGDLAPRPHHGNYMPLDPGGGFALIPHNATSPFKIRDPPLSDCTVPAVCRHERNRIRNDVIITRARGAGGPRGWSVVIVVLSGVDTAPGSRCDDVASPPRWTL